MQNPPSKRPEALVEKPQPASQSLFPVNETEQAWTAVQTQAESLAEDEVESPRVDLQRAAPIARRVGEDVLSDQTLLARFATQEEAGEIEPGLPARLVTLADAAWHARRQQLEAEAADGAVTFSATFEQAATVRARMQSLAEYYFNEDPTEGPLVRSVAGKQGAQNTANALDAYADLYARHHPTVSRDTQKYRPTDARDARRLAREIRAGMASGNSSRYELWTGRCARVWTLLYRAYDEVQQTGSWMLRRTPEAAKERFPSMVEQARAPRRAAKKKDEAPVTNADGTPATPAPAADTPAVKKKSRRRRR